MKSISLLILLLMTFSIDSLCQQTAADVPDTTKSALEKGDAKFTLVDESATFPGGMGAFYQYIAKNLEYPKKAKRSGVQGKVYVEFVIRQDGSVDAESVRCPSAQELAPYRLPTEDMIENEECRGEAMRLIRQSPQWNPGKQKKQPVMQRMTVPIIFKLPRN